MPTRDPGTLGAAVRDRRRQLGLSQRSLAAKAHVSESTIYALETGRSKLARVTEELLSVEAALMWEPGSLISVRDGGEPTELVERRTITDDLSNRLPMTVAEELDAGEVIDYAFESTEVDGVRRVIVTIRDPERPPLTKAERRRLVWQRRRRDADSEGDTE